MDNHMVLLNNARATRQNYLRGIRELMLFLDKRPEDCTVDELKAYLVHARDHHGLSSSSVNLRVCGLKYYCREVVGRLDLVVKIPNHRYQRYFTEVLSTQEVQRLFGACRDMRQQLVLQLIYEGGLRVRELIRLRVSDFDKQLRIITIRNSKGRKTRTVPYGDRLRQTLVQYCQARGGVPADTIIESITEPGNPLTQSGVRQELGAHIDACDQCGHLRISYNSCRNRHCPKCQGLKQEMWTIQQEDQLLPTAYFHVVFTLPHELNGLCLHNPRFMYDLLLRAAWYTLHTFAADPKWLGAKTAATMVLHTWGQTLVLHPHVHCIVPNGGLTAKGQWQFPKRGNGRFLYPVQALKKVFKAFFLKHMRQALEQGLLALPPGFPSSKTGYYQWKETLYQKQWVVFTKKPFAGVQHVVRRRARYSHRVAITNHRLKTIDQEQVHFEYKDYQDQAKKKIMALCGPTFLKRFCLHILPPRFRKIRQYGFLANACKARDIALARKALGAKQQQLLKRAQRRELAKKRLFQHRADQCPCCLKGQMVMIGIRPPNKDPPGQCNQLLKIV